MLLCNITHNLSVADAQLLVKALVKFLMKAILNSVNNTALAMLRHDNDVEAESKTRYKVLRAVKIQGNNFPIGFRGLSKAKRRLPSHSTGVPGEPIGGGIRKKYCPHDDADQSPADLFPSDSEQPGKKFRAGFGNCETFDENCQGNRAFGSEGPLPSIPQGDSGKIREPTDRPVSVVLKGFDGSGWRGGNRLQDFAQDFANDAGARENIAGRVGASGTCRKIVFKDIAKASPNHEALFELECSRFFNPFQLLRKSPSSPQ